MPRGSTDGRGNKAEHYLEDFATGQTLHVQEQLRIEAEQIKAFAAEFDPQPFHLDAEATHASLFGGLPASGSHTAAFIMRLLVDSELRPAGGVRGCPVSTSPLAASSAPGDQLSVESGAARGEAIRTRADKE